jgi:putative addiction module component (TIGR02574 family)
MPDYQTVLSDASQLAVEERLRLIDELASSVPDDQPPHLPQEWLDEVNRRSDELDVGTVTTENWSTIRARLFAKHGVSVASISSDLDRMG